MINIKSTLIIVGFLLPFTAFGAITGVYISEDHQNLGIECDSSGNNTNQDADYLSNDGTSGGFITSNPDTGKSSAFTTCPSFQIIWNSTYLSQLYTNYGNTKLWVYVDPNPGSGVFYEEVYIKTCDSEIGYYATNECPTTPIATSTATSTASLGDISFGLAIIITLMSFGLVALVFNVLNKKK